MGKEREGEVVHWNHEKYGWFSIKSSYNILKAENSRANLLHNLEVGITSWPHGCKYFLWVALLDIGYFN